MQRVYVLLLLLRQLQPICLPHRLPRVGPLDANLALRSDADLHQNHPLRLRPDRRRSDEGRRLAGRRLRLRLRLDVEGEVGVCLADLVPGVAAVLAAVGRRWILRWTVQNFVSGAVLFKDILSCLPGIQTNWLCRG